MQPQEQVIILSDDFRFVRILQRGRKLSAPTLLRYAQLQKLLQVLDAFLGLTNTKRLTPT